MDVEHIRRERLEVLQNAWHAVFRELAAGQRISDEAFSSFNKALADVTDFNELVERERT